MNFNLISACLSGNASDEDYKLLDQWRKASKDNEDKYQQSVKLWQSMDVAQVNSLDISNAWN